jgi:O-methyltransferase domain
MYQELPKFLAKTKYENITDNTKTVLQDAWKTDQPVFMWFPQHPEAYANFNQHMASRREAMATWLSVFPVEQETRGWDPQKPVFIDIGGGIGHQCAELKAKYPELPGRVILQDLPHCIDHALPTPGVESTVADFFQPQPVKGMISTILTYQPFPDVLGAARFYYMRGVLHDFPDDKCRLILQSIMEAMGKDSLILIDEMVLPNTGVHWQATQIDLTMMSALASMERTHEQWSALLDSMGLKITKTYVYTPSLHESVIVAVPK